MADIELVIKISEEQYEMIQNISNFISADATQLIRDGIPLSKDNEDAIGRSDMLDAIGHGTTYTSEELQRIIKGLPPVNLRTKTGHWIYDYVSADGHRVYHCSECGCYLKPKHSEPLNSFKWCSLCGAKMIEPQESEEV